MTIMPVGNPTACKPGQCTRPVVQFPPYMRLSLGDVAISSVAQIRFCVPEKSGRNSLKGQEGSHSVSQRTLLR